MSQEILSKERLLSEFAAAYEGLIEAALAAAPRPTGAWGPREVVAHLAGWEVMASVRVPHILAGMAPMEFADPAEEQVMNDAINAAFVAIAGDQAVDVLCATLRRAYQRTIELLDPVDASQFQPGTYVYERTLGVIHHCREHREVHLAGAAG